MKSYRREREGEREGIGTIGLDWLLGGWRGGWGGGWGLVPLASPSPHSSPHSPFPQSLSSPHSTSI